MTGRSRPTNPREGRVLADEFAYITGTTGLALGLLAFLAWFVILAGSCALVAAVYAVRDWWRKRGR